MTDRFYEAKPPPLGICPKCKVEVMVDLPNRWDRAIASGSPESWKPLERFGIHRIVQCHHSDERKVVAHGRDYPVG